jgi:hypothetical protein
MKTKKPTLVQILNFILDSLQKNILPKDKDALKFLTLIKNWEEEKAMSLERRRIFQTIFETFKRRCVSKDPIKRKNEIWATINTILPVLGEKKDLVFIHPVVTGKEGKQKSFFPSFTFDTPHKEYITFMSH